MSRKIYRPTALPLSINQSYPVYFMIAKCFCIQRSLHKDTFASTSSTRLIPCYPSTYIQLQSVGFRNFFSNTSVEKKSLSRYALISTRSVWIPMTFELPWKHCAYCGWKQSILGYTYWSYYIVFFLGLVIDHKLWSLQPCVVCLSIKISLLRDPRRAGLFERTYTIHGLGD